MNSFLYAFESDATSVDRCFFSDLPCASQPFRGFLATQDFANRFQSFSSSFDDDVSSRQTTNLASSTHFPCDSLAMESLVTDSLWSVDNAFSDIPYKKSIVVNSVDCQEEELFFPEEQEPVVEQADEDVFLDEEEALGGHFSADVPMAAPVYNSKPAPEPQYSPSVFNKRRSPVKSRARAREDLASDRDDDYEDNDDEYIDEDEDDAASCSDDEDFDIKKLTVNSPALRKTPKAKSTATPTRVIGKAARMLFQKSQGSESTDDSSIIESPDNSHYPITPITPASASSSESAGLPKVSKHDPSKPYVEVRGARKSNYQYLVDLDVLNSLPYKYCIRCVFPKRAVGGRSVNGDDLVVELVAPESEGSDKHEVVKDGMSVEKLLRTSKFGDRQEFEFRVAFNVYSHGHSSKAFAIRVRDSTHVLYQSQDFMIFARRNRGSKSKDASGSSKKKSPKRKRSADEDDSCASPTKKKRGH